MKIGHTLALANRKEEARKVIDQLQERGKQRYVPPYRYAFIYAGLGDRTRALEWLEKAYEERDVRMVFLKIERGWDGLRGDAHFQAIVKRLGLE